MMDAKTAYETAVQRRNNLVKEQVEECKEAILSAINKGEFSCVVHIALVEQSGRELINAGYTLRRNKPIRGEVRYIISWDTAND